jgi:AMP-polyphosphate phosphotransferase
MLEKVDFDEQRPSKDEYKLKKKDLASRLVVLQQEAIKCGAGLVVLFEGWNGSGRGSRISDLMYFLDARATSVYAPAEIDKASLKKFSKNEFGVEDFYPFMKEYWDNLGERGHITFFDRGWYDKATQMTINKESMDVFLSAYNSRHYLDSICDFERQLTDDGYTVVKFFLHISKKVQKKRLKALAEDDSTKWRVSQDKLESVDKYDKTYKTFDRLIGGSDYDFAPWTLINGEDKRIANLEILETLCVALEVAIEKKKNSQLTSKIEIEGESTAEIVASAQHSFAPDRSRFQILNDHPMVDNISHDLVLEEEAYKTEKKELQKELYRLENLMYRARVPLIVMFEGWDAAGKGGAIKRVAQSLDARSYTIIPSPAPTKPELAHPHLWRYWTRLPKAGHVGLFDRSWYGRVLVERVEEITPPELWARGYDEINEFEYDLVEWGAILIKFWVNVSSDEQLNRFKARQNDPDKQWKITDEDWRNRDKYEQYKSAIDDMFRLTHTSFAPWDILESDDKPYARVKVLRTIVERLHKRLEV